MTQTSKNSRKIKIISTFSEVDHANIKKKSHIKINLIRAIIFPINYQLQDTLNQNHQHFSWHRHMIWICGVI